MKKLLLLCLFMAANIFAQHNPDVVIANQTITGSHPDVVATGSITLKPNTWIKSGATFHAYITDYEGRPYTLPNLSSTENYVFTRVYQRAMSTSIEDESNLQGFYTKDFTESIAYFDGLGRGKQSIGIKQSPGEKDIVTHMDYDVFGRQDKEFYPM